MSINMYTLRMVAGECIIPGAFGSSCAPDNTHLITLPLVRETIQSFIPRFELDTIVHSAYIHLYLHLYTFAPLLIGVFPAKLDRHPYNNTPM